MTQDTEKTAMCGAMAKNLTNVFIDLKLKNVIGRLRLLWNFPKLESQNIFPEFRCLLKVNV